MHYIETEEFLGEIGGRIKGWRGSVAGGCGAFLIISQYISEREGKGCANLILLLFGIVSSEI
jgi:hypothetical protein